MRCLSLEECGILQQTGLKGEMAMAHAEIPNTGGTIVTGATGGIGRAIAQKLASEGAHLVLVGRDIKRLQDVSAKCESLGGRAIPVVCDLAIPSSCSTIVEEALDEYGSICALINNAGVFYWGATASADMKRWDEIVNVNFRSVLHLSRLVTEHMIVNKTGAIINISSIAGKEHYANGAAYAATKHALHGFSKSLFEEVRDYNVKVCCVFPDYVDTKMPGRPGLIAEAMIRPEDIACLVSFVLAFPHSSCPTEITILPQKQPRTADFYTTILQE